MLLALAYRHDGADPNGGFGALGGIRCCGAAITSSGDAGPAWRLTDGAMTAAEWQAVRTRWLTPALALARTPVPGAGAPVQVCRTLRPYKKMLGTFITTKTEVT
jgi:hypothetical protein